jgi:hypothetical protein
MRSRVGLGRQWHWTAKLRLGGTPSIVWTDCRMVTLHVCLQVLPTLTMLMVVLRPSPGHANCCKSARGAPACAQASVWTSRAVPPTVGCECRCLTSALAVLQACLYATVLDSPAAVCFESQSLTPYMCSCWLAVVAQHVPRVQVSCVQLQSFSAAARQCRLQPLAGCVSDQKHAGCFLASYTPHASSALGTECRPDL